MASDLKIKISLSNFGSVDTTPVKPTKKKKKLKAEGRQHLHNHNHSHNQNHQEGSTGKNNKKSMKKHSEKKRKMISQSHEKTKVNISHSLAAQPVNDNVKGLAAFPKPNPRHWEERWVLNPNVFAFTANIWLKKWVRIDSGDDATDNRANVQPMYSKYIKPYKDSQKKYVCTFEDCGKFFFEASAFKKHQGIHGERLYICADPDCGKKFLDNSKLRRHQLVHTGEKPFKCDLCDKKFSLDFNLKTHLRTHTGEKPYICTFPGCEKRFTQSSNLTAHERTHKEMTNNSTTAANGTINPSTTTFTITNTSLKSGNEGNANEKKVLFTSVIPQEQKAEDNDKDNLKEEEDDH